MSLFRNRVVLTVGILLFGALAAAAQSGEFVEISVERLGYAFKIPREFTLDGKIDATCTWKYRPSGALPTPPRPAKSGDESEPALTITVNRTPLETRSSRELFHVHRTSDLDAAAAANPTIKDLKELTIMDGYGYWYKETDKESPDRIHRWIVKLFGNKSVYTICLGGGFKEFETWGPVYEEVINSFVLIPLTAQ